MSMPAKGSRGAGQGTSVQEPRLREGLGPRLEPQLRLRFQPRTRSPGAQALGYPRDHRGKLLRNLLRKLRRPGRPVLQGGPRDRGQDPRLDREASFRGNRDEHEFPHAETRRRNDRAHPRGRSARPVPRRFLEFSGLREIFRGLFRARRNFYTLFENTSGPWMRSSARTVNPESFLLPELNDSF